jgi:hypothetical protein
MNNKNVAIIAAIVATLSGCGYSQMDSEMSGQVKRMIHLTPIICPNYYEVDFSLGVMRDGVGSMSTQDVYVTVPAELLPKVKEIANSGKPATITYNKARFALCTEERIVTDIQPMK